MPRPKPSVVAIDPTRPATDGSDPTDVWSSGSLTVRAAAAEFGIPVRNLFYLMKDNHLAWRRPGKTRLIARASIVRWLASHPSGRG